MCRSGGRDDGGVLDWVALADGLERVDARGLRSGYAPHSHDSYVIGFTVAGEQCFRYRRAERCAMPGEAFVLHPGETHDGRPGRGGGYGYRALYIAPRHIAGACGRAALPFVPDVVSRDRALRAAIARGLAAEPANALAVAEVVAGLAAVLSRLGGRPGGRGAPRHGSVERVREALHEGWREGVSMRVLEAELGMSRYSIARQFRRSFGVSPSRYVMLRRLDHVRGLIRHGESLAAAAHDAGFADQSHMSRQFLRAFGMTPGAWRTAIR